MNNSNTQQAGKKKSIISGIIIIAILVILDQITKAMAVNRLMGKNSFVIIDGVFQLTYLENRGAAFGMLQNQKVFFVIGAIIVLIAGAYVYYKTPMDKKYLTVRAICILMSAGAIGNMIDRIINNYVIDFFYFVLIDFPIFNVADCYVTIGAILMLIAILFIYKDEDFKFLSDKNNNSNG